MRGLVQIGIPSYRFQIHSGVGNMLFKLGMSLVDKQFVPLGTKFTSSSLLANSRNTLVLHAITLGADYLLMVDADTCHGASYDICDMLAVMHDGELPVIAAPYKLRNGKMSITPWDPSKKGTVFECDRAATGFMAINLKFLKARWPKPPWFHIEDHADLSVTSEDEWFCSELRKRGGRVWCDARFEPKHFMGEESEWIL